MTEEAMEVDEDKPRSSVFAERLAGYLKREGTTLEHLGRRSNLPLSSVNRYFYGSNPPPLSVALSISAELNLTSREAVDLAELLGYPRELAEAAYPIYLGDRSTSQSSPAQLQVPIDDLKATLSELLEEMQPNLDEDQSAAFAEEIENMKETLAHIEAAGQELTAPVRLPRPEDMEIQLVSTSALDRLEEYRSDENIAFTVFGVCLGGILAVAINLVTGGEAKTETWIILGILAAFAIVAGGAAWVYRRRGNLAKQRMLRLHKESSVDGE